MPAVRRALLIPLAASACLFEDPGPGAAQADAETGTGTGTGAPTTGEPPEPCGWEPRSPAEAPPARIDATLTLDEEHGKLLLYGGRAGLIGADLGDTWSFDGAKWTQLSDSGAPGPRRGHAAAWHAGQRRVVLFGGEFGGLDAQLAEHTWLHDGKEWSKREEDGPSLRAHAAMAGLPQREEVVLFGGRTTDGPSNETWIWDGFDWTEVETETAPSPRFDHTMALDEATGQIVLHGGCGTALCPEPLTDTWAFDGVQWTPLDGGAAPGPRAGGMAYDRSAPALLRFGEGEGWRRGGDMWTTAGPAPQALAGFVVAYHPGSEGVVLFGGLDDALGHSDETWLFRCAR